jgi:hypothetical protein
MTFLKILFYFIFNINILKLLKIYINLMYFQVKHLSNYNFKCKIIWCELF